MKLLKKIFALSLVVAMISSTSVALAAESTQPTLNDYAYMNLETAPIEMREDILKARNTIIYSKSWTVDNACSVIRPDGTEEALPDFYDLFPSDWEVPFSSVPEVTASSMTRASTVERAWIFFERAGKLAIPFFSGVATQTAWTTTVTSLPAGNTYCNLGYTNSSGRDVGYLRSVAIGHSFRLNKMAIGSTYSVRASTNYSEGWASFNISY